MAEAWVALLVLIGFFVVVGYLVFLVVVRAFRNMGFTGWEAVIIVAASFLLGYGVLDAAVHVPFSNLPLFTYGSWQVGVNAGGAVVPLLVCLYLVWKHRMPAGRLVVGVGLVAAVAYGVTVSDSQRGVVAVFPWWLLPVLVASLGSVVFLWRNLQRAAPFAYVTGVCGVLLGADVLHLVSLLQEPVVGTRIAVIGGASVFDMVFTTGLLAVLLDSILVVHRRSTRKDSAGRDADSR